MYYLMGCHTNEAMVYLYRNDIQLDPRMLAAILQDALRRCKEGCNVQDAMGDPLFHQHLKECGFDLVNALSAGSVVLLDGSDKRDAALQWLEENRRFNQPAKPSELELLKQACRNLFDAPHQEHFETRLNDEEMAALDEIRERCGWEPKDLS